MTRDGAEGVEIRRLAELRADDAQLAAIDRIFFAASLTRTFPDAAARATFRERWLGRYLAHFPREALVAVDRSGEIAGYLVGALPDPARDPRFSDIGYFRDLAAHTAHYPAHLHINLADWARGQGIGPRLIEAFCSHARSNGAGGVHVVTGQSSRNRSFYDRCGFGLIAALTWNGTAIVMLGRLL